MGTSIGSIEVVVKKCHNEKLLSNPRNLTLVFFGFSHNDIKHYQYVKPTYLKIWNGSQLTLVLREMKYTILLNLTSERSEFLPFMSCIDLSGFFWMWILKISDI